MTKIPNYDETIVYEIRGDIRSTNKYIGYTTNYTQKKSLHKRNSVSSEAPMYVDIRDNGGWDEWIMRPIKAMRNRSIGEIQSYIGTFTQYKKIQEPTKTDFKCDICEYECHRKFEYKRHCESNKHMVLEKTYKQQMDEKIQTLKSNSEIQAQMMAMFKDTRNEITILQTNVSEILKTNQELQQQVVELSSKPQQLTQIVQQNTQHNSFNIQVFLNKQCANAMNLSDFLKTIKVTNEDLVHNTKVGFVEGMAAILIREMCEKLTVFERPVHCTDLKRDTVFYKEGGTWHKENGDVLVKDIMEQVSRDCLITMTEWRRTNPAIHDMHSEFNLLCDRLLIAIMAGSDRVTLFPKTMNLVYKHCLIDKKTQGTYG